MQSQNYRKPFILIFFYLDTCFSLLPVIAFCIYWTKSKYENGLVLIVLYSLLFFAINVLLNSWSQLPLLYDFFTLIEFLVFCGFLFLQLKNKTYKKLLSILCTLFTLFYIGFTIYAKGSDASALPENEVAIDSIPIGIETIIILPFAFYFLYERTSDATTLFIYKTYEFWIVLGIVLYLAGSFFIYLFANYMSPEEVYKYWVVTNMFSILRSCFFVLAIVHHAKPTKNSLVSDYEMTYLN